MHRPTLAVSLAGLALLLIAPPALAESIGFYKGGSQTDSVPMPVDGPEHYLLFPPKCYVSGPYARAYPDPGRRDNFYGHPSVIRALRAAAASVRRRHPDAPRLPIGEISNRVGGEIPFHLSHQNGLDADIWFLQRPGLGGTPTHPVPRCSHGTGFDVKDPKTGRWAASEDFEPAWNWALAEALAANDQVTLIFVSPLVEKALARWARAHNVPPRVRSRTLRKLYPVFCRAPKGVKLDSYKNNWCPHDDHLHVRFKCPKDSPRCHNRLRR